MKTSQKGFISPLLLALIALLLIGGGAYVYVQNKQGSQNIAVQTSDLKTYSNARYGFEFNYPAAWIVAETKTDEGNSLVGYIVKLTSPHEVSITVSFSDSQKDSANCPVGAHEIECKELENTNGFRYTRTISTGQLPYDKQKQLNGYFVASNMHGQMNSLLTDISGNPLPFSAETVAVFDGILQSMKFVSLTTANVSDWQIYKNDTYGIQFSYPRGILIREKLNLDDQNKKDPSYIPHPYFHVDMELPFVSKYDTWSQKSLSITVEDISGGRSCFIDSDVYTNGEKVIINGREYYFSKSYRNLDSGWTGAKITTEKDSAVNTARADYVTKTNSFCYSVVFFLNGSGSNSEELYGVKNPTYPSNSETFFNSELEIFNKVLDTVIISN